MSGRALILGAGSPIAEALARQLAADGWALALAGRHPERLEPLASDLRLRHEHSVDVIAFDALDMESHAGLPGRVEAAGGPVDLVICVFGYLGDPQAARSDTAEMLRTLSTNFTGAAVCLAHWADAFEARGRGGIIGIGSVAGDRGRQSNYPYGAAKGGFHLFLQGLRNRLTPAGIHVLTVKPGFVDTPMTQGRDDVFLVAPPARVAADILRAWRKGRDVIYTPWFWRWLLLIIRWIPERLFKRLQL